MLRYLFPRIGSQFREGGLVHVKFVTVTGGAGSTFTAKVSGVGGTKIESAYPGISLVRDGAVGFLALTVPTARDVALLGQPVYIPIGTPAVLANFVTIQPYIALDPVNSVYKFKIVNSTGSAFIDPVTAGDELHFSLYINK